MKYLTSQGKTIVYLGGTKVSIVSYRAARFVLEQSRLGKWSKLLIPFREWVLIDGLLLVGYQFESNQLIAVNYKEVNKC